MSLPDTNAPSLNNGIKFLNAGMFVQRTRAFWWKTPKPSARVLALRTLKRICVGDFHRDRSFPRKVLRLDLEISVDRFRRDGRCINVRRRRSKRGVRIRESDCRMRQAPSVFWVRLMATSISSERYCSECVATLCL